MANVVVVSWNHGKTAAALIGRIGYRSCMDPASRTKTDGGFRYDSTSRIAGMSGACNEHRVMVYSDATGNLYVADCPELQGPIFGPRLLATIGWLKSVGHCSYSALEMWMEDVLQVPVSRGYLAKLCTGTISQSLADGYDEVVAAVPHQNQLESDETSIKDNGKKHWIWCITAATLSLFHIATTRSREVLEKLVGPEFRRIMNFDFFSANCSFAWNYSIQAQYCWAHLIRDIRFLTEHPDRKIKAWASSFWNARGGCFRPGTVAKR